MGGYLSGLGQAGDEVGAVSIGTAITQRPNGDGEVEKSQRIRLFDVILLAPFLAYVAWKGKLTKVERWSLAGIAIATAYFNGRNWMVNRQAET